VSEPVIVSALGLEARFIGRPTRAIGLGARRARTAGARLAEELGPHTPVAMAGVAGSLRPDVRAGDVLVASELRTAGTDTVRHLDSAPVIAAELRRAGMRVHVGPLLSSSTFVRPGHRAGLAGSGAVAVDMESAFFAAALGDRPLAVVRTIADGPRDNVVAGGVKALRTLVRIRPAIERWSRASGPRHVVLASPRAFCAGVERAIDIVERALERFGRPVFVRRQIVHNRAVVSDLERKGAVFVDELCDVPDGATVVLAAHGVSPEVRSQADARPSLSVIDATCPLVAKVHHQARRFAAQGYQMVLIGHADHEEVIGTRGEAPERISVIRDAEDVERLDVDPHSQVAFLTQTTLAMDETAQVVDALRRRFPDLVGPGTDDICYASQNRQEAVRSVAGRCDLMLVVGSTNSSNTARLVEVARRQGCRAELLEDAGGLRLSWLEGAGTVGVTAGASAPDALVQEVVGALATLGPVQLDEHKSSEESVHFALPQQVR
jgi:4-hydroxy-3-methylbut-2-enyl diphosphate reductase